MPQGCTPDNVMGQLVAGFEAMGKDVDQEYILKSMENAEKAAYFHNRAKAMNDINREAVGTAADKEVTGINKFWKPLDDLAGRPGQLVSGIITEQRNPSGLFGEETVKPVIDFVTKHHQKYKGNLEVGRGEYFKGIKAVFNDLDTSHLKPSRQGSFEHYKDFYTGGGELYAESKGSEAGNLLTNLSGNTIQSSTTVLLGNILEGGIKLPALYPDTFLQGTAKGLWKGKGIFKIPELEQLGVYGREYAGKDNAPIWEKIGTLIEATDVPLKNALYYAGALKGGQAEGLRAVQRGAFLPRFGDLPSVYYTTAGRNDVRFLSYTINTWKLYSDLGKGVLFGSGEGRIRSAWGLGFMTGMPFVIGGLKGGIPEPVADVIGMLSPETKEFIDENKTPLSGYVKVGGVQRLGVAYSIGERQLGKVKSYFDKGAESLRDGDNTKAAGYFVRGTVGLLPFTNSPLGDMQLQKLLDLGLDVATDDLDEPLTERVQKDLFPAAYR